MNKKSKPKKDVNLAARNEAAAGILSLQDKSFVLQKHAKMISDQKQITYVNDVPLKVIRQAGPKRPGVSAVIPLNSLQEYNMNQKEIDTVRKDADIDRSNLLRALNSANHNADFSRSDSYALQERNIAQPMMQVQHHPQVRQSLPSMYQLNAPQKSHNSNVYFNTDSHSQASIQEQHRILAEIQQRQNQFGRNAHTLEEQGIIYARIKASREQEAASLAYAMALQQEEEMLYMRKSQR